MRQVQFNFNHRKATQALNYFAKKECGHINKMKALKLVYFADRYHLRKYGRLITNDTYFAMDYGSVPSGVKDIAEQSDFLDDKEKAYAKNYLDSLDRLNIKSVNAVDDDVFSESDFEALNYAWNKFGQYDQFELANITHSYPEWKKHKVALDVESRIQMYLQDFLEDPDDDADRCFEPGGGEPVRRFVGTASAHGDQRRSADVFGRSGGSPRSSGRGRREGAESGGRP